MKKLLFFLAALMFVTSCSKDTTSTPEVKGEKVVSFKVTAPKIQTRYGEGAEANKLFWAVYKDGQRLEDISAIDPAEAVAINMSVDVDITLMEGLDYDILFWAQNENAPYTFDGEKVTIDYDALSANEEIYDAFFRNYHVDADQTEPHRVELRRPFAQLNIGTADTAKAATAGFTLENTSVTVEACTVLDLATGEASEPKELTFAMSQKASDTYGEAPDTFDIISMNYLLVNNEKEVVDVTFNAEGGNDAIEREYLNVPLQRNHRTYILGDILTSSKRFNVYINPAFEDEDLFNDPSDDQKQPVAGSVIYYTSTDGNIVEPNSIDAFDANIIENTYENGQGKIVFDGQVIKIEDWAFGHIERLKSITIPDGVLEIGYQSFQYCENLESVIIGNDVTKIGNMAFLSCEKLTHLTLGDSIVEIGENAFDGCDVTNVTIPSSVTKIGGWAFSGCKNLETINIPNGITTIEDGVFSGCKSLTSIIIPNGVSKIGGDAFAQCAFTSITIPNSVIEISIGAFSTCRNLKSVTLSNNLTEIAADAFCKCRGLTDIVIPDSVIKIGGGAFTNCISLETITIPANVEKIDMWAFGGCNNLSTVYCKSLTPPTTGQSFLESENPTIYVPTSAVDAYKNADGWSDYADRIFDGGF